MKKGERKLFTGLCNYKSENFDADLLYYATPEVLGRLFINRMQGVAYGVLRSCGRFDGVCREFVNSLKTASAENAEKNRSYFKAVEMLSEIVEKSKVNAAFLKGAVLCGKYPEGFRTSNDVDLLLLPEEVSALGRTLSENGFLQGKIVNGEFIRASREEILSSKINRGETVPYIKEISLPKMRYLEVDLNFSLDCRPDGGVSLGKMLSCAKNGRLSKEDFFIHLCLHLYKEATNLPWIKMKRDMTLYKYCDIYSLIGETDVAKVLDRATDLGVEKETAFALFQTEALFDIPKPDIPKISDPLFFDRVSSLSENKTYLYKTSDVAARFFSDDRLSLLREEKR